MYLKRKSSGAEISVPGKGLTNGDGKTARTETERFAKA